MEILIKAGQLILSLSILIVLHELGHFIPARLFKTRVEKFYLFFNPWFSLFKVKRGDTEWGLGWLPLGGYVKIAGMIDESMDKEQMNQPPQEWEFRAKPAWQRLIIMLGGVTVNFILGFILFIMVYWVWGKEYLPTSNAKYGVYVNTKEMRGEERIMNGDQIFAVGGIEPKTLQEAGSLLLIDGNRELDVIRNGQKKHIVLPDDIEQDIMNGGGSRIFDARFPYVVEKVTPGKNAEKAGILPGDSITGVNGKNGLYVQEVIEIVQENKEGSVELILTRNGEEITKKVDVNENGQIGVQMKSMDKFLTFQHESFTFTQAVPEGISGSWTALGNYVKSMSLLFTPAGAKQLGGFGSIGGMFSSEWDWQSFWAMTAMLSLILAFMNLLPIPALDGGHVIFLIYEIIRGKPLSQRFMEVAQTTGMILLLGLMLFANGNDILKLF